MPTLKDIANKTGVSMMTVSRAFNSPELVKEDIRNRIMEVAKELEYKPNQAAKSLAANKTGVIQVVLPKGLEPTDPYFANLFIGIADYLSDKFYSLIIQKDYNSYYQCDGMIIMGVLKDQDTEILQSIKVPCVLFGKTELDIDYVDINNKKGIYDATNYLINKGHRNIGFMAINQHENFSIERLAGYVEALKDSSITIDNELIISSENNISDGKEAALTLLKNDKVTGVVCSSDLLAISLLEAARDMNKKVPEDLSIIGFDGIYLDKIALPNLTTVVQPVYDIGRNLAKVLLDRIENNNRESQRVIYDLELIERDSTRSI